MRVLPLAACHCFNSGTLSTQGLCLVPTFFSLFFPFFFVMNSTRVIMHVCWWLCQFYFCFFCAFIILGFWQKIDGTEIGSESVPIFLSAFSGDGDVCLAGCSFSCQFRHGFFPLEKKTKIVRNSAASKMTPHLRSETPTRLFKPGKWRSRRTRVWRGGRSVAAAWARALWARNGPGKKIMSGRKDT